MNEEIMNEEIMNEEEIKYNIIKYKLFDDKEMNWKNKLSSYFQFIFGFVIMILAWSSIWSILFALVGYDIQKNFMIFTICMIIIIYINDKRLVSGMLF